MNASGQPLGVVDLDLMLDNRNHVVIAPGIPALLQLDFDLAASHEVDITTVPVTAVARPFVVATIEPVEDKELRVRGPLVSVDTNASNYVIDLRPFNDATSRLGRVTVLTNASTAFEIDGVEYEGAGVGAGSQVRSSTSDRCRAANCGTATRHQEVQARVHRRGPFCWRISQISEQPAIRPAAKLPLETPHSCAACGVLLLSIHYDSDCELPLGRCFF